MKIAVCCCTFNRPRQLSYVLRCFERQDYADREMVILDDAGQYLETAGDRWRVVSIRKRFASLAEKRNACASLVSDDVDAIAIWDDDDLYLPWQLSAHALALQQAEWSRPSLVLLPTMWPDRSWTFRQCLTGGLYHGGWAYRRGAFNRSGGYPPGWSGPEDRELMWRMERRRITQADPVALSRGKPAYVFVCERMGNDRHISGMLSAQDPHGARAWQKLGMYEVQPAELQAADPPWFSLEEPVIEPKIHARPF